MKHSLLKFAPTPNGLVWALVLMLVAEDSVRASSPFEQINPVVEVEEEVYSFEPADNGAGPMWCYGNTSIVRLGEEVLASGLHTVAGAKPLNNCVPSLYCRSGEGWQRVFLGSRRTREPSPIAVCPGGKVFLSVNPTTTSPDTYGGPAEPALLEFDLTSLTSPPQRALPEWEGMPEFTEHSYRSFVVDRGNKELILFQNIGYTHAEWSFRDREGSWSAQGKLVWPWGTDYEKPQPIRICYPAVALHDRQVYFCGVSDIVEPNPVWRDYKRELTGREWDYDFRRLFFTWCDDITTGRFHDWIEIASRESTAGRIAPDDLYVSPNGDTLLLWNETALDERLREKFFPRAKQRHSLELAAVRDGKVVQRTNLMEAGEGLGQLMPGRGRFHLTEDGRLWVFYYVSGVDSQRNSITENRIVEVGLDGQLGKPVTVKLQQPLGSFFTNTVRAGCQPSNLLDLFGQVGTAMRYARVRLK